MRAERSKKQNNHASQLNRKIAEGKRKGESYREELSLQDVFSDSGNASGIMQKTSRLFENEQGRRSQLQEEEGQKPSRKVKGGRRKLQQEQKRRIKLQTHVTQEEYEKLTSQSQITGMKFLSDYLRLLILDQQKSGHIINKQDLIKQLDKTGAQIGKMGNNINQIAKYANIQVKSGKVYRNTLTNFNQQMSQYLSVQQDLVNAYSDLIRNKGQLSNDKRQMKSGKWHRTYGK